MGRFGVAITMQVELGLHLLISIHFIAEAKFMSLL